ncbi:FlgD immunoglobulin-like domain containing protein [Candidatus Kapabacteria bacterium]|nr:FlgD immunoglobulin-like domain containing protein [Candidatus Kapabacteria bacterium]
MRRFIPLLIIAGILLSGKLYSQNQEFVECMIKAKSCIPMGTVPAPFQELQADFEGTLNVRWDHDEPAISTGYYFVTNESLVNDFWRPKASDYLATESNGVIDDKWITITQGPRLKDKEYWDDPLQNTEGGYWFFRNPASNGGDVFDPDPNAVIDSTDDAIAGPMRLGLPGGFRFNGIRYDSFYVSTNGLIALTNRRYIYAADGNRRVDTKTGDAYDRESMDWYQVNQVGRQRSGDGLNDATPDDYGYRYAVLANNPNNATAGIRQRGGTLNSVSAAYRAAVIAPFFGDMHLSQYARSGGFIDPHGKVMYRRSDDAQKLYISIFNMAPKAGNGGNGTRLASPCGPYNSDLGQTTATADLRFGNQNYTSATSQIILSNTDSSVTIIYFQFLGNVQVGFCQTDAVSAFRYNTTAGVSGYARHDNFNRKPASEDATPEYQQYTHHWIRGAPADSRPGRPYPRTQLAVKYKQWQNTLRVADIQYRVRNPLITPFPDLSFSQDVKTTEVNNYELLAGEERIGAIQPVALIQNLSNDIQGSRGQNFVKQDLEFRARFSIKNQASGRTVFQKLTVIDEICLSLPEADLIECSGDPDVRIRLVEVELDGGDYTATEYISTDDDPAAQFQFPGDGTNTTSGDPLNGVPSYGFVKVNFPPFEPSEFVDDHIGRLKAFVIAVPQTPEGDSFGDEWPFDDTTSVNLFVLRRLNSFYDDGTEFHLIDGVPMPSVWKWVNIDAQMANGEQVSKHPLPPRGTFNAQFVEEPIEKSWLPDKIDQAKAYTIQSPVIKMNRLTLGGGEPATNPGGDEIRSFPIDMRGRENSVLSISVQRTTYVDDWERGWSDARMVGPEPRVLLNGNDLNPYTDGRSASQRPDEIVVELANNFVLDPNEKLFHVTNIDDKQWRTHFRRDGADTETNMPALGLYGAGGYRVGFLESDPDSSLAMNTGADYNGLRPNRYDDGIDEEYQKFFVSIPDTFVNFPNEVAENFRFRVRVMANNDQKPVIPSIPDDDDDFYVDNVKILFEDIEATDIEVSAVKVKWPYTRVPATQATAVPVEVKVTNNTSTIAPSYLIKLEIFKGQGNGFDSKPIYCRISQVSTHNPRVSIPFSMPSFNAKDAGPGAYRLRAIVQLPGDSDKDSRNDTTYYDWSVEFGDDFAYDPIGNPTNDVSGELNKPLGRGLNFFGSASGGNFAYAYDNVQNAAGVTGGSGSGQVAMKFVLTNADTLYGYKAFFGTLNQARDDIQFSLFSGDNTPGQLIAEGNLVRLRGQSDIEVDANGEPLVSFDEYVDYRIPNGNGIVLQPGSYWIALAQLGETGLELAASKARGGMRITNVYLQFPDPPGASGIHLNIHKDFRTLNATGDRYVNDNLFAFENSKGSNQWNQFMPTVGNPGYAHLHHVGRSPVDNYTFTMSRGFWIPLLRPYFGEKEFGTNPEYQECIIVPVELAYFNGNPISTGNELYWETKSETDSKGFYIERKLHSETGEQSWVKLPNFVEGRGVGSYAGTTQYDYLDSDVNPNVAYDYRLRQVDIDGSFDCHSSGIVTLEWTQNMDLSVTTEAYPNPFTESTKFTIHNPENDFVTVEILDLYGNAVATLLNAQTAQGPISLDWDGRNQTGNKVAQGTYIYRVSTSNGVISNKINYLVK